MRDGGRVGPSTRMARFQLAHELCGSGLRGVLHGVPGWVDVQGPCQGVCHGQRREKDRPEIRCRISPRDWSKLARVSGVVAGHLFEGAAAAKMTHAPFVSRRL